MRAILKWAAALLAAVALGALLTAAYFAQRRGEAEETIKVPSRVSRSAHGENAIRLDAATQARIALRTQALAAASLRPEIIAYGRLEEDPSRSFTLRAPVAGTLRAAAWPAIGATVRDGAVIGTIEPRLAPVDRVNLTDRLQSARADVESSNASLAAARAAFERARKLNADGKTVSDRAVEEAEARMKAEQARHTAAAASAGLIESSLKAATAAAVPLVFERGGQVVETPAQPGESVESGQPLMRVARLDRLMARITVPAGDALDAPISSARITAAGHEDRAVRGERIAVAAAVDPRTPGQTFLFSVSGLALWLRPGQAVTAHLELPGAARKGAVIPAPAILRYLGKTWAYVETSEGEFVRKEVTLGDAAEGGWFTPSLAPGSRVVVEAAQTLLSEELKSQIQVGEENPD